MRNKQIIDFVNSVEVKHLNEYYSQPSIFGALGVSRHENTHSNFLAWLLTPKPTRNDHGFDDLPLRKLLEALALVCGSLKHATDKLEPNVANAIISGGYSLSNITVEREKHIGVGRLDIYIEGTIALDGAEYPLRLVIENKIKSTEHDSQTGRYQEALNRSISRPGIFLSVYLTPLNNRDYESLDAPECEAQDFIQLNYQYLVNYVITPCRDQAPEGSIKKYLDEYLLALGLPELRQDKGDIIMAVSKEERDLLSRFWDRHKDLLMAAIVTIGDHVPLDDAEHKIVSEASQAIEKAVQRDITRYSWGFSGKKGNSNLPKNRLVLEIVGHYAAKHPTITLDELKQIFPDTIQGGTFGVFAPIELADSSNFKGHKRYYTEEAISLTDCSVAVSNQWRAENISAFIDCAEQLGYKISSSK